MKLEIVKLPAHSAGLPGNDLLFNIVPLDPAQKGGACGARSGQPFDSPAQRLGFTFHPTLRRAQSICENGRDNQRSFLSLFLTKK